MTRESKSRYFVSVGPLIVSLLTLGTVYVLYCLWTARLSSQPHLGRKLMALFSGLDTMPIDDSLTSLLHTVIVLSYLLDLRVFI